MQFHRSTLSCLFWQLLACWHSYRCVLTNTMLMIGTMLCYEGTLVMNARNYVGQSEKRVHRYIAHSHDGGETWPIGWFAGDLPDPIVFSALAADAAGKTLYLTHPASATARRNVSLFSSEDGGWSWTNRLMLDSGPGQYSAIAVSTVPTPIIVFSNRFSSFFLKRDP